MRLFRPVGLRELQLIASSGFRSFPARLPHQPIFYPVLTESYAIEIARDWNTRDAASGYAGFVTRFSVPDALAHQFGPHSAGSGRHLELWVPAERLVELNASIVGLIQVVSSFTGPSYEGTVDPETHLPDDLQVPDQWAVWRQDDNGNRVVVNAGLLEAEARALVSALEARGHKQMYWMEPATG